MKKTAARKAGAADMHAVYELLAPLWPDAKPLLHYSTCFELLCAVMLSAQCTDEQVNKVTPLLFGRWPDAASLAAADEDSVAECIHSVGFFRTKARHLVATARILAERRDGGVPDTMEALLELPGVGRKTANLVISACAGKPGIIVDTHVLRVAFRLGFETRRDPGLVEAAIAAAMPPAAWTAFSHALNRHGKHVCTARSPACASGGDCPLAGICPRIGV